MSIKTEINNYIEKRHKRFGFTISSDYNPILSFKLTNYNSETSNTFKVVSVKEAEDLVISYISTSEHGNIFVNDIYDEDKELYLKIKVTLPS
jgi:hypothetical protein